MDPDLPQDHPLQPGNASPSGVPWSASSIDSDIARQRDLPAGDAAQPSANAAPTEEHPQQIGRYEVRKILGQGGFGRVYLAYDGGVG